MPFSLVPINPKDFDIKGMADELQTVADEVAGRMKTDYEAGVQTWGHKVDFTSEVDVNINGAVSIEIDTDDLVYLFVHEGTKAHDIFPRRARYLRFQSGYTAKTQPGAISSRSGGPSGPAQYRSYVRHPGTEGRRFGTLIKAKWDPFFKREMQRALDQGAKRSNHSI